MSEQGTFWITASEKLFGLILVAVSIFMIYSTVTNLSALGGFSGLFGVLSAVILVSGVALLIYKPPE